MIGRLVVVGTGLIGGSLALALREAAAVKEVVGVGRGRANLDAARARGIADRVHLLDDRAWLGELAGADVVLVAAPVAQFPALFAALAPALGPRTLVTDAGSTKGDVVATARAALGQALARFVPAHPIAGSERSGAAAADSGLFRGRRVVLTPLAETDPAAVAAVEAMWRDAGAQVSRLGADAHDRVFAAVSHLPHLLAFALVDSIARRADGAALLGHAGAGFRDFTRIAASSPEMWRDIALSNREALLAELDACTAALAALRGSLAKGDGVALEAVFARAREARRALGDAAPLQDDA